MSNKLKDALRGGNVPQRSSQRPPTGPTGADLIGATLEPTPAQTESAPILPVDKLVHYERNPRRGALDDTESIAELATSIRERGLLQALLVRPIPGDKYEVIAGNRRLAALRQAGIETAAVDIRTLSDSEALEIALMENLQREDLSVIDQFDATIELVKMHFNLETNEAAANLISDARNAELAKGANAELTHVRERLEKLFVSIGLSSINSFWVNRSFMFSMPHEVAEALRSRTININQAKALAKLDDLELRNQLLQDAVLGQITAMELDQRIREHNAAKREADIMYSAKRHLTKSRFKKLDPADKEEVNRLLRRVVELLK